MVKMISLCKFSIKIDCSIFPKKNSVASIKSAFNLCKNYQNMLYKFIKCKISRTENVSMYLKKNTVLVFYGCVINNHKI